MTYETITETDNLGIEYDQTDDEGRPYGIVVDGVRQWTEADPEYLPDQLRALADAIDAHEPSPYPAVLNDHDGIWVHAKSAAGKRVLVPLSETEIIDGGETISENNITLYFDESMSDGLFVSGWDASEKDTKRDRGYYVEYVETLDHDEALELYDSKVNN